MTTFMINSRKMISLARRNQVESHFLNWNTKEKQKKLGNAGRPVKLVGNAKKNKRNKSKSRRRWRWKTRLNVLFLGRSLLFGSFVSPAGGVETNRTGAGLFFFPHSAAPSNQSGTKSINPNGENVMYWCFQKCRPSHGTNGPITKRPFGIDLNGDDEPSKKKRLKNKFDPIEEKQRQKGNGAGTATAQKKKNGQWNHRTATSAT